jgi:dephospho-CoA kinase
MRIVVVTGGIGSGKSVAVRTIREEAERAGFSVAVASADDLVHEETNRHSHQVWLRHHNLPENPAALMDVMVADPRVKRRVEQRLHCRVALKLVRFVLKAYLMGYRLAVLELPLWYELQLPLMLYRLLATTVLLTCPQPVRQARLRARGYGDERIRAFMRWQLEPLQAIPLADVVLKNDSDDIAVLREALMDRLLLHATPWDYAMHPLSILMIMLATALVLYCH